MPLRRLGADELNNTLRDLLGDSSKPASVLPGQGRGLHGFPEAGVVSVVDVEHILELVESVAAAAAPRLPSLLACGPMPATQVVEDACIRSFVVRFGRRAFRRPLGADEIARYVQRYRAARANLGYGFLDGARVLLQVLLFSPNFLYHWELGPQAAAAQGTVVRLTPHELAARLSYFLWASMPDEALFAAVDAGRLKTQADIEYQARRMLADGKARPTIARFHSEWLMLDRLVDARKDKALYPMWNDRLADAMAAETAEFVTRTIIDGDGRLETLLTSSTSYINPTLARLYGVDAPAAPVPVAVARPRDGAQLGPRPAHQSVAPVSDLMVTHLDPTERAGLFTQASFLAAHATATSSHPVKRGHEIFLNVLCGEVRPPKFSIPPVGAQPANVSTRELFAQHAKNECTGGCHDLMDPLGFAFEHYDAVGRFRTVDGGKPVDASGTLSPPSGGPDVPFDNAIGLARALVGSEDVQRCMVKQWFRFAFGRREVSADEPSLMKVNVAFRRSGLNVRELLVSLSTSLAFRYRASGAGEVLR